MYKLSSQVPKLIFNQALFEVVELYQELTHLLNPMYTTFFKAKKRTRHNSKGLTLSN